MTTSNIIRGKSTNAFNILSWIFGISIIAAGLINTFWGNDPFFGIFLILLAFLYFPPITSFIYILSGFSVPGWIKILLAIFLIMAVLGVGELFDKIELMKSDLL